MSRHTHAIAILLLVICASFSALTCAQTLSLNDGTVLQSNTNRVGVNIGAIDYYDNGQILKNLIGSSNPGLEPLQARQIWALTAAGTTTTFTIPDQFDGVPPNYWAGSTFTVVQSQSGGAELGCTGTIASNTGPNYPLSGQSTYTAPTVTISTPCQAPFSIGDVVIMSMSGMTTPEAWWESGGRGGTSGSVSGGAQLLSDTTDLCATCGAQALNMNATATGSSATASWYFDSCITDNIFVLMNGTYKLSFWAKAVSGTPVLTATASRSSSGGFSCTPYKPTLSSSWAQYSYICTAAETPSSTSPGIAGVSINVTGGSVYLDNVDFEKTNTDPSNTTVLRDEVIETLQNFYGPSIGNNPGTLRYWVNQNAETMSNWTQPDYAHSPTSGGTGYFAGPGGAGSENLSLEDYLVICQLLNAEPYLEVPVTLTTADAANLIEFLASPSTTTYGARRAALGQEEPWTSVFGKIHLAFCNECWNGQSFMGQSLPMRNNNPGSEYYYDYSMRARDIFAAMRADSYYSSAPFDLVMNAQTAVNYTGDIAIARAHPDSIEIEDYTYGYVNDFSSDSAIWQPAMVDPWEKVTNPSDIVNFYQSVHDYQSQKTCGATGTATCNVNIYEWGQGTMGSLNVSGVTPASDLIDQTHLDYVNAGAGEGVVMALQPLLNMQYYGIGRQSYFSLTEFRNNGVNGLKTKLWGNVVDMGGATNNVRPTFLGVQLVNQSIIGPMYSCPISNNPTYNFAGSINGVEVHAPSSSNPTPIQMPAMNNVPYLYAFCFENGTKRSLVLINTDLSSSHTLSFTGSNPPQGAVIQRQLAPDALDDLNEAHSGIPSTLSPATVAIETSTLSSPSSITLPPFSATALDYTATGLTAAAAPVFSPAAGTYTSSQSVTISDSTPGTTIYYTTNGSTPTTSSSVYSGPITVNATETLEAIAIETGYSNSAVATAAYTISAASLPAPTFSPAAGTYTVSQSVAISNTTAGTTIYYTTNGTAPTTSSAVYSTPITVSTTETLEAIAVKTGYANSAVATAAYTITSPSLPAPTFSVAAGVYTTSQSVTISDATAGTTIYYTTNGTTPTTSSSVYSSPITVSATETLEAIAVKSGYSNSPVATAAYIISSGSTSYINYPNDGFTTSALNLVNGATVSSGQLQLTDGGTGEARAAWFKTAVPVQSFITNFTFQQLNATADGMTFTIQNGGIWSLGYSGAGLGYQGIGNSAAVKFDLYDNAGEGSDSTGLYTNGVAPTVPSIDLSSTGINFHSGDVMSVQMVYNGTNLTMTLTDTVTNETVTEVFPVNIPSIVGGNTAYVGFTGSTGGTAATQNVLSWSYLSPAVQPVAATPTFSPVAGTYTTSQTVTITDATAGTTIYYTTNGTTPMTSSSVYSGPITVSATETLEAVAVETGYTNSAVATAAYTISPVLPTPTFSVGAGTYTTSQTVTISDATAGATIYYTTNGTTPTTSSSVYSSAITVSATETLEAIAVETGYTNSAVATATYTINPVLPTPTFSVAAGTYTTSQTVTISDATAGATIYYTTNGTTPTTSSSVYSGTITVSATETLEAIAVETGYTNSAVATATYTINPVLPTPTFSVAAGTYTTLQTVTISDATAGTTIYYTTNGTTPTTSSSVYSSAITVSATETLEAIAVEKGYTNSAVATVAYTINPVLPTPTFSLAAGTYTTSQTVTITDATAGTTIFYTTNGTTPTTSSSVYSGPITVSATETLEAIAIKTGYTNSAVATAVYTIAPVLPTPTFSLAAGAYTTSQTVTISDATAGTTIYYTTNGTTPTTSSSVYGGAITVGATETLEAIAVKTGYTNSAIATATYTINPVLPTPTFSVVAGTYTTSQTVTISDATAGTTIYYTTNGTAPTTSSTKYNGSITVNFTETLEAIAVEAGYTNSAVATAAYTINPTGTIYINYPANGFTSGALTLVNGATVTGGLLQVTDGGAAEERAAWFTTKVPVQSFVTDFTFQQLNATADGMTFVIQSGSNWALGDGGGGLGYQDIASSVAVKFDLYNDAGEGSDSTGLYTNGAAPTMPAVDLSSTGINLHSGDAMHAHIVYDGTNLTMTLTDTVTNATATEVFPVNIPSIVGSNTAYIGFTGGTGSVSATQNVLSWTYVSSAVLVAAAPTFSPAAGTYTTAQTVTINDATAGATIYYTTNGTTPTTSSTKYTGLISVSATETLEAIAVKTGYTNSAIATAAYTINPVLPTPTFSVAAGTYTTSQTVTITDATAGATIYYTTNGTTPTTSSTKYTGPISVSATEMLEAIAVKTGYTNSAIATAAYTISPLLPAPTFSPAAGTYATAQTVTISDATAGTTIYYTTNGTAPTTSSTKYTGPITVSATETLKALAVETGCTNSAVSTAAYTINSTPNGSQESFSFDTPGKSATVAPGGLATFTFTITPLSPATTIPAAVNLSATGLPTGATSSFSPASVAEGAGSTQVTLTVQLPRTTSDNKPPGGGGRPFRRMAPIMLGFLLLPFASKLRGAGKRMGRVASTLMLFAAAIVVMTGITGCGSTNSVVGPSLQSQTYTVTVTGTSGTQSESVAFTLTVAP